MVPLREARHARDVHCNLMARKDARRRFHISSLRAVHSPPSISICGATNGCDPSILFVNTTEGLIVMAFKLCQEGNWEPLIERIVFANGSFEPKCRCMQMLPNASPPRKGVLLTQR